MRVWAGAVRAAVRAGSGLGEFRERFDFGGRDVASWFPGHMAKGLRQMRASLRRADCLIEVHDARIPLSGRNPELQEVLGIRPHILVLNKMDLADPHRQLTTLEHLKQQGCSHVVFTDCQHDGNVKKSNEYSILVIGVPNVGKSSLINSLRRLHLKKGKATAVGGEPGVTKAVLTRIQVCEKPLMYLVDTPGVLPPRLKDVETGIKLAVCGAIHDHLVGEDIMADYLLYALNKHQQFEYVQRYGLAKACNDIETLLRHVALAQGQVQKVKVLTGTGDVNVKMLNYTAAAYQFLRDFRAGCLGRVTLD
ncbi:mitochondrial ribosome-associated GTPase 1 isoform X2 [Colius striatus]|uniref:mitochondrial ribosome-associated GTPase 1 isoform X2 n=1 Tax=Colius striatus TaxID=57412 RepID=UPI002B1D9A18|nr:mitochondrial ribosome-associated GTPase 1 isoform X2 [Colius striatus]